MDDGEIADAMTASTHRVLVIDNYDSFTYNLVQYLLELGARLTLVKLGSKQGYACPLTQYLLADALGLGSGLIGHIQKMTIAAITMADMKVWAQRSYRVWMRRQSLSLPNMFSILWRFR